MDTDGNHPSSVVYEHINLIGHPVTFDRVKILCKKDKTRRVKEPIKIYKDGPALNRDDTMAVRSPPFFSSSSHVTSLVMWDSRSFHLAIKSL